MGNNPSAFTTVLIAAVLLLCVYNYSAIVQMAGMSKHSVSEASSNGPPRLYTYKIINEYEHDAMAFTQGLSCANADCTIFHESTGLYGETSIREVDVTTGKVVRSKEIPDPKKFGEGLVKLGDEILLLLWRTNRGLVYNAETLEFIREFHTPMKDGWGFTVNPSKEGELFGTDSSDVLYVMELSKTGKSLRERRRETIHDGNSPVPWVNEIEMINDEIWGMVWQTECVARIDPSDGHVTGWVMMDGLTKHTKEVSGMQTGMDVLNGIAYSGPDTNRIFMTGKKWPRLYEVEITELAPPSPDELEAVRAKCIKGYKRNRG